MTFDLSYGTHPGERLDIFPAQAAGAPVNIFVHGGYWHRLDKADFSFVARAFRPAGAATVVINYALMPSVDMDELVRQCRAAVAWTWLNAPSFGSDPDRLYVSGHSAGGHLTAMLLATDWASFGCPADVVKGGVAISGLNPYLPTIVAHSLGIEAVPRYLEQAKLVRDALHLDIDLRELSVYEVSEKLGTFDVTLLDGSVETILSGGFASGTTVLSGGVQNLDSGTTTGTTISAGGTQNVAAFGFGDYGTAIGTTIASGGLQVLGTFEGDQGTAISTTSSRASSPSRKPPRWGPFIPSRNSRRGPSRTSHTRTILQPISRCSTGHSSAKPKATASRNAMSARMAASFGQVLASAACGRRTAASTISSP
jgi:autotransporter passenger strand-loop-strand repeat protein